VSSAGTQTRQAILATAGRIASTEGLEALSIGRLSAAVGMSKSGLFAHFGSKQQLQIAVVDAAREVYAQEVLSPGLAGPRGLPRLLSMCEAFLSYVERAVFPGGCFFAAAAMEYDARTGAVRDEVARQQEWWLGCLERLVAEARDEGHLISDADPAQLAFEVEALLFTANHLAQLRRSPEPLERARCAIRNRLAALAPPTAGG